MLEVADHMLYTETGIMQTAEVCPFCVSPPLHMIPVDRFQRLKNLADEMGKKLVEERRDEVEERGGTGEIGGGHRCTVKREPRG